MYRLLTPLFVALSLPSALLAETVTSFEASLSNVGVFNSTGETPADLGFSGSAVFTLTEPDDASSPTLAYQITLTGFANIFGAPPNDLDKIHLHSSRAPDGSTINASAGTPHVFNILGIPAAPNAVTGHNWGGDDADLVVTTLADDSIVVSGLWDDSDELIRTNPTLSSLRLSDTLDALKAEQLHLMIHSQNLGSFGGPGGPAIGGRVVRVPEPATGVLAVLLALFASSILSSPRRRSRRDQI